MTLSAAVSTDKETSGTRADRPACTNLTAPKTAGGTDAPPLQRRIQASRDNARKPAGPKTVEGRSNSRNDAIRHGINSGVALPRETVVEIADDFWRLVQAYRPDDAVTVNAILELTICSWKFRRLFEQYASIQARARLTVNDDRKVREIRLAQRWYRKLTDDPRKALAHLRRTTAGLSLMIDSFENLIAELNQPEGTWTSRQFLLAVNLGGFDDFEVWDNVRLRSIWSAWFACRPGRKGTAEDFNSFLPAYPEYRIRAKKAIETAPLAAEGRRQLIEWVQSLRDDAARRLESQEQVENDLVNLQPMAAGWPAPEETSQHLLFLRYSNQVDRKARELQALIDARHGAASGSAWKFDVELLPSDWKVALIEHRTMRTALDGLDKGESTDVMTESLMKHDLLEMGEVNPSQGFEKSPIFDVKSERSQFERSESLDSQQVVESGISVPAATSENAETDLPSETSRLTLARPVDLRAPQDQQVIAGIEKYESAEVMFCTDISTGPADASSPCSQTMNGSVSGSEARPRKRIPAQVRSSPRKLRPDKATDIRRDRHRHTGSKPARPPEKCIS